MAKPYIDAFGGFWCLNFLVFHRQPGHTAAMRKWFNSLLGMLIIAVVVGVVCLVLHKPVEPVYQGKRLRVWLQKYQGTNKERPATDEAVRHMGTNSIPTLLNMLCANDPPWRIQLLTWASKQRYLGIHYTNPSVSNEQAFMGFQALGSDAVSAVPELIKILDQNVSESSENYTARTLAVIGPEAKAAVPLLLRAATSTNVSDHSDAIWALGQIHADSDKVIPVLIRALRNPAMQDQLFAAIALGKFQGDAKSAVPALLEALKNPKPIFSSAVPRMVNVWQLDFRREVEQALQKIDPETYARMVTKPGRAQSNSLDFLALPEDTF